MEFWLAPLHGITHHIFRSTLVQHVGGLSKAITPFLPVQEKQKLNVRRWTDILPENNTSIAVIPQLIGHVPAHFVDTINALAEMGYHHFNWNIGCPAAQVVRKQRGCGIMPFPDSVEAVVDAVTSQTDSHFSVKMRMGLHDAQEGFQILERLSKYHLDFICVHPRLGVQEYRGLPDYEGFQKMQSAYPFRFVYSGDVVDIDSYHAVLERYNNVNTCLLGRGILRNIFLAEELSTNQCVPIEEKHRRFQAFYADYQTQLLRSRTPNGVMAHLKELWHYFAHLYALTPEQLLTLLRCTDFNTFENQVANVMLRA